MSKKLTRSSSDKWLGGVLGGIAEYLGWDPTLVRLIFLVVALVGVGSPVLVYLILWVIMPQED